MNYIIILRKITFGVIITWCTIFSSFGQNGQRQSIIDTNSKPAVFMQEGVSVPTHESVLTFTPDCNTVYIAIRDTIFFSKLVNGNWTKPIKAPFSKQWGNWDPALSPDGKRL
jgi:hypothetical protein